MNNHKCSIGIDLGGTKIDSGLINNGKILKRHKQPTNVSGGYRCILEQIVEMIEHHKKEAPYPIQGIGIGVPGQVNSNDGSVIFAPHLFWNNVPLKKDLESALKMPVVISNDVRVAAWGEWNYGAGRGFKNIVLVYVGTGIGGGIIIDGHILHGANNMAAEIGHMIIDPNGPKCTCGNTGCLDAHAGGGGITRIAQKMVKEDPKAGAALLNLAGCMIENITPPIIAKALQLKDPMAEKLLEKMVAALSIGVLNLVHILNPERIIFGGGMIEGFPVLISRVKAEVQKKCLPPAAGTLDIVPSELHDTASLIGAAALILT